MEILIVLIVVLIFILIGGLVYLVNRLNQVKNANQDQQGMQLLQQQLLDLNRQLDTKLGEANKLVQQQLQNSSQTLQQQFAISQKSMQEMHKVSSQIMRDVTEKLTKVEDTNTQIVGFANQLQSLENILKNPKQRGILGEYFLETLLKNVLPPGSFQMQYKFSNGVIVDAAVFVQDKVIPIDAKFSLENYNRILASDNEADRERLEKVFKQDLRNRIDETSKYILPEEGTMGFAFMFIPSEGIYYDLLINKVGAVRADTDALIEYAFRDKQVIIVSPTSFLAFLQTVLQGLRALKIEEQAQEIKKNVEKLRRHLQAYEAEQLKLGRALTTAVGAYNGSRTEYKKIDKDVLAITGDGERIYSEELLLDKPVEGN